MSSTTRLAWGAALLALLVSTAASAVPGPPLLINNGLAPPNPENIIDSRATQEIVIRNVGCGDVDIESSCANPGAPTTVEVQDGAQSDFGLTLRDTSRLEVKGLDSNGGFYEIRDSATLLMVAGGALQLQATFSDQSRGLITGGSPAFLTIRDEAIVQMLGGRHGDFLSVQDVAVFELAGRNFTVDGVQQDLGALTQTSGLLQGLSGTGESLFISFTRAPGATLLLVPEPGTALLVGMGLIGLGFSRRRA